MSGMTDITADVSSIRDNVSVLQQDVSALPHSMENIGLRVGGARMSCEDIAKRTSDLPKMRASQVRIEETPARHGEILERISAVLVEPEEDGSEG